MGRLWLNRSRFNKKGFLLLNENILELLCTGNGSSTTSPVTKQFQGFLTVLKNYQLKT